MPLRITGFLVGGFIIFLLLAALSDQRAPVFAIDQQRVARLMERAPHIEMINFGPSHNRAIDYETLGVAGQHAWFAGSDLRETVYFMENMYLHLPRLRTVLICIAPTSLHMDNALVTGRERNRHKIYFVTPGRNSWKPIAGNWQELFIGKLANVVRDDHWREVFSSRSAKPDDDNAEDEGGIYKDGRPIRNADKRFLPNPAIEYEAGKHAQPVIETLAKNPRIAEELREQLDYTLTQLKARGLRVVLFTPPYTDLYYGSLKQLLPAVVEENRHILQELAEKHAIRYIDFREHAEFAQDYRLFYNIDHLNSDGAKVFSRALANIAPEILN